MDRRAREADGPALIWANAQGATRRFLFSDIARLSAQLASALVARGVRKGDRVLIMLPRIPEWQIAMVACLKLGAVAIPCIEMLTGKDLRYRIERAEPTCAIIRAQHHGKFEGLTGRIPTRLSLGTAPGWEEFDSVLGAGDESYEPAEVSAEDPAILYFTSGSTGLPKGVLHASRAIYAWRGAAQTWLDLGPEDTIWCTADVGWSKAGTSILFGPWSQGACAFFYDGPFDARGRLGLIERFGVTVYCAPGTELFRLVDEDIGAFDLSALRRTVTAGEALNPAVAERWRSATGLDVAEAYGQTESLMTVINPPGLPPRPGSMGVAAPGSEIAVIGPDGTRLADGVEGDLAILTPNPQLMLGYWGDQERTAQSYLDGPDGRWFVTGDRAKRDPDGYFYHLGRSDDIINSAGYRIGPSEVENALLEHPAVFETAAIGVPDRERGEIVKAFVILRPGHDPGAELVAELQAHVKAATAPYKYPRLIEFIDVLPRTPTGKIQRSELRRSEAARAASSTISGAGT
ncbi:acyl-CoA synthetase [Phenylobacterium sp.]|uniref:acyl-CoA synthetase n=1 Tax=Phenylobacterium sp. TaxID=1871053 RepID=UPI002E36D651|nr:AMP-binding protein [Phenylobacterium sp.]HEX3364649.1 AMP-binding protein [Phenylobacterium sp.]